MFVCLLLLGLLISTLSLTGCAPPTAADLEKQFKPQGRKIIVIPSHPIPRKPFQTVTINGTEFRQARGAVGRFGGTFYSAQIGDGPKTFNPWASFDGTSSSLGGMMLSGLVDSDAYTGQVIPALAKSVELLPDRCTVRVILRKGLTWSDGQPLTSKDVVFTWTQILAKGLGNPSSRDNTLVAGQFPSVRALDDLTLEFKTAKPFAPFMRRLGTGIAPAHVFEPLLKQAADPNKVFSAMWSTTDAAQHPEKFVSSGLWILGSYDPVQQRVVFKRNPRFYMVDRQGQRLPYLDQYIVQFVGDMNNLELQFEQGKLDSYGPPGKFLSHVRLLPGLGRQHKPFKLYNLGPAQGSTFVVFNLSTRKHDDKPTGKPLVDPVQSAWFRDVNFRRAVDWAINRQDMVLNILKGVGAPSFTAEGLSSPFLNPALAQGHPMDLDRARGFLKQSGFYWDASGQLYDRQGHAVSFTLNTNTGNEDRESTGVNIKQDLARLGIQVNFKPMDFNVLVGKLQSGEWEAMIMGLGGGSPLEPHDAANVWKSDAALHLFNQREVKPGKPIDLSDRLPWEKALDEVFEQGALVFDLAERKQIYNRYQQIVADELPMIYLYSPVALLAVQDRIQNLDPTPLEAFHNLEEIWIKEAI